MAERSTSGTDERTLTDTQNFEHGTVSNDAVYVPHSKQPFRGRRGRGKSSGNYRHGQQSNESLDRPDFDASKQSGARSKYSGGRGRRNHGRRNAHSAAYDSRHFHEYGEANSKYYSESNITDHSTPFGASADTYNGVHHAHSDETEFGALSLNAREQHVGNSRVLKKAHDDRRYEERSQKRDVDQQPSRRGRYAFSRGRAYRGASNYPGDEKFATANTRDASLQNYGDSEAVAASDEADLHGVMEFTNSDRRNFGSNAQFGRHLKSNSEKLTVKDDEYVMHRSAAVGRNNDCVSDSLRFRDLHVSAEMKNLPNAVPIKAKSQAVFNTKIKNTDPEFETQRGNFLLDDFYVCF